jgi:hypothetical protein
MGSHGEFSMDIWQFQRLLTQRLIQWALASIGLGALLSLGRGFWRGMGLQFLAWGAVDFGIAWFGTTRAGQRMAELPDPTNPQAREEEALSLRRLLWLGVVSDVAYLALGDWLAKRGSAFRRGSGWGVILQGAFLFIFDLAHVLESPER